MAEAADPSLLNKEPPSEPTKETKEKPSNLSPEGSREWDRLGCLCPVHLGEEICCFCTDCNKSCCVICSMKDHYKHQKKFIDTGKVDESSFGHTGIYFPSEFTVEGRLMRLNEDLQDIDIRADDAREKIKACVERHKASLETSKKDLVDHVTAVKKARLKHLLEQQKHLKKNLNGLISVIVFMNQCLESDDKFSVMLAEKEITRRVVELNEKCSKVSLPNERDWNLDKIKVVRDGKYVGARPSQRSAVSSRSMWGSVRTVHDPRFNASSAKVTFKMEPGAFKQFVKTCCTELGEDYKLQRE